MKICGDWGCRVRGQMFGHRLPQHPQLVRRYRRVGLGWCARLVLNYRHASALLTSLDGTSPMSRPQPHHMYHGQDEVYIRTKIPQERDHQAILQLCL